MGTPDSEKLDAGQKTRSLPGRLVFKILSRHLSRRRTQPGFAEKILPKILQFWDKVAGFWPKRLFLPVWRIFERHQSAMLWCVFLLLWHPGIYSRSTPNEIANPNHPDTIPPRPEIYAVEQVRVELDTARRGLILYMEGREVAAYPIAVARVPRGEYCIKNFDSKEDETIAHVERRDGSCRAVLCANGAETSYPFFVQLERDYWEMLYPYLRLGSTVIVQ